MTEPIAHTAPTPGSFASNWIADVVAEVRLFFTTFWAFTRDPRKFALGWSSGQLRALNPLGFFATSFGIMAPVRFLVEYYVVDTRASAAPSWVRPLLETAEPYFVYIIIGIVSHGVLRILGSQVRLPATLGITLFAGGGPVNLIDLLLLPFVVELKHTGLLDASGNAAVNLSQLWQLEPAQRGAVLGAVFASAGALLGFLGLLSGTLVALHGMRVRWVIAALFIGFTAKSLATQVLFALAQRWGG